VSLATPPLDAETALLDSYSATVSAVAELLLPSVASLQIRDGADRPRGGGSAVVITGDGFLVTSAHVVRGAQRLRAVFGDGEDVAAEVIGADPLSDLAVVRAQTTATLPVATLGDADSLRIGQLVIAVGSPLGYHGSVSAGVVSGLGRSLSMSDGSATRIIDDVIQTDAGLHPGNSGGALASSRGDVVGINTAVVGTMIGQGLGLAVPINAHSRAIIGELMQHGRVERGYLGVGGGRRPLPQDLAARLGQPAGFEITSIVDSGPAALGGVQLGDMIVAIGARAIQSISDVQRVLGRDRVGAALPVVVVRASTLVDLEVVPTRLGQ
jgi:S1-C subfamily serine protease